MINAKTPPTQRWTLALDESGRFEGKAVTGERDERGGWVVGGVLLPGGADDSNRALDGFRRFCLDVMGRWPPHASEHGAERRLMLAQAAGDEVRKRQGAWIFVVTRARGANHAGALGRFVRMFGATIDFAGRLTAALGGGELDVRPARRSIPLDATGLFEAANLGVVAPVRGEIGEGEPPARAMLEAETRHALDALGREPAGALGTWPALTSVAVESASKPDSHAGLALADVGCNRVYGGLWADATEPLEQLLAPLGGVPIFVVDLDALRTLRALDRALRQEPADLVAAARLLAGLRADVRAAETVGRDPTLARGTAAAGERLWQHALTRLTRHPAAAALATILAPAAEMELALKKGAYEGTWLALDAGWSGTSALATAVRQGTTDRVQVARLWRLVLECANHRGDVAAAVAAVSAFDAAVAPGRSYRLLAEELMVRNLAVVARQNQLPADGQAVAEVMTALARETERLDHLLGEAGQVLGLAIGDEPAPAARPDDTDSADEQRLWAALAGGPAAWVAPDRERGMGHGTVARSLAFLGLLDQAAVAGLRARALFSDSAFDRRINAAVLARILVESARLGAGDQRSRDALSAALALCGAGKLMGATHVGDLVSDPGLRFTLDVALRALLWAPSPGTRLPLLDALLDGALCDRLAQAELRSHPSELVARHAGELVRRHRGPGPVCERWFALSVALSDEAAQGSTLHRLGGFTRRLARDAQFGGDGPPGSILNPTFEYR